MFQSKKRWILLLIRLIGSILCIYFSGKGLSINLEESELAFGKTLILCFIGFMGILNFVLLIISYEIEINDNELLKKSVFGLYKKRTSREKITRFAELYFDSYSLQSKSLFLLGDKINIEISSTEISNYEEIKNELIKGLKEDKIYKNNFVKYLNIVGISILILIPIIVFGYFF